MDATTLESALVPARSAPPPGRSRPGKASSAWQGGSCTRAGGLALGLALALGACSLGSAPSPVGGAGADAPSTRARVVYADVVALDQVLTYNRFGSHNPYAMIYALKADVVSTQGGPAAGDPARDADPAVAESAAAPGAVSETARRPGEVRLRDGKRPRPLVLRGNVGDVLEVQFTNLLRPEAPDLSRCEAGRCDPPFTNLAEAEPRPAFAAIEEPEADPIDSGTAGDAIGRGNDWPSTRRASLVIPGIESLSGQDPRCTGLQALEPGMSVTCRWKLGREGAFQFFSQGAPAGGEGDGGSLNQGLFGVVNVEPAGSRWYRSQVDAGALDAAWTPQDIDGEASKARPGRLDYARLDMLAPAGADGRHVLRHGDLNAIVHECALPGARAAGCKPGAGQGDGEGGGQGDGRSDGSVAFREFTVVFHDELKTFYADPFTELESERQFQGIGDGFAINYGASGMGSILLANRKGIGPAAGCVECVYEEFFLQSWANGDPALLEEFADDPSNVHHSYLNDRVRFRNLHVGKETHVFHLHAHQWESTPGAGDYLDSQTIAPGQAFQYEIYHGGLRHQGHAGAGQTQGSGNRNRTVGDSIFHCHLYPHFAQGMWALWRVHDVIEDGRRTLPDGQAGPDRLQARVPDPGLKRPGTDPKTGQSRAGSPIPAVVPLPGQPLPPLPSYGEAGMPGYPFYVAGEPGHRAPQPPLDFAPGPDGRLQDGGLPRHRVTGGVRGMAHLTAEQIAERFPDADRRGDRLVKRALALGDFSAELESAQLQLLPDAGTPGERAAMDFHAGGHRQVLLADGHRADVGAGAGYPSLYADAPLRGEPGRREARFHVNGAPPARGAPFADPCRAAKPEGGSAWDPANPTGVMRTYDVSAVQFDLVTNKAGWHDPQARINVLTRDVDRYEGLSRGAEPFYFRAVSGECIEFRHSNRTPKDLELDDFQVRTPTDTIGQHIHLVKFDVTSSDGSANGWNYEDGSFAPDAVHERICAALNEGGGASAPDGSRASLTTPLACLHDPAAARPSFAQVLAAQRADGRGLVQTTVQRWFADPLLSGAKDAAGRYDRTLGTVFTHDHFGASSIQQHGFYSALLIEPQGAEWLKPDGTPLADGVGSAAMIVGATDAEHHPDQREFALAVADFALLYEPRRGSADADKGLDHLITRAGQVGDVVGPADLRRLRERQRELREHVGAPVAAPSLPESISTDHHDPYLVNYKGEPLPLRVGERSRGPVQHPDVDCERLHAGSPLDLRLQPWSDVSRQRGDLLGNMEWVFYSRSIDTAGLSRHGDPCTPVLRAYQGERIGVRLIQGAQEVQHNFQVEGLGFPRMRHHARAAGADAAREDNVDGLIGAQEVGISEHFEFEVPALAANDAQVSDHLYHFGSQDAIWNGAWGLLRAFGFQPTPVEEAAAPWREDAQLPRPTGLAPLYGGIGNRIAGDFALGETGAMRACPAGRPFQELTAVATRAQRLGGAQAEGLVYRAGIGPRASRLVDPDALLLLPVDDDVARQWRQDPSVPAGSADPPLATLDAWLSAQSAAGAGGRLQPFVARVKAGDCVRLRIYNALRSEAELQADAQRSPTRQRPLLRDAAGDARMPPITSLNVDGRADRGLARPEPSQLRPGAEIGFSLPLVTQNHVNVTGRAIGATPATGRRADAQKPKRAGRLIAPVFTMEFYAGRAKLKVRRGADGQCERDARGRCLIDSQAEPYAFGPLPLKPLGDVIGHGAHGLYGAVIVEPQDSSFHDPEDGRAQPWHALGTEALICRGGAAGGGTSGGPSKPGGCFREFVAVVQDSLNLQWRSSGPAGAAIDRPVADCPVCDDSYDFGEKGVNYRSEPFWARLRDAGQSTGPAANLNGADFHARFLMPEWQATATPRFEARAGEELRFRVLHPSGRARQRSFLVGGHDYEDIVGKGFGSPGAVLIGPGKAFTVRVPRAHAGCWFFRDGTTTLFSGGSWGSLRVASTGGEPPTCEAPADASPTGSRPRDAAGEPAAGSPPPSLPVSNAGPAARPQQAVTATSGDSAASGG